MLTVQDLTSLLFLSNVDDTKISKIATRNIKNPALTYLDR